MQRRWHLLVLVLFLVSSLRAMDASISFATFQTAKEPYIEIYFHLAGTTLRFLPVNDSMLQARLEALILFQQGENIVKFDKYTLNSPLSGAPLDIMDLRRYALAPGEYDLTITLKDLQDPENTGTYRTQLEIGFSTDNLMQSDLMLLSTVRQAEGSGTFIRNGLFMEPLPFHFYGKHVSTLFFYEEIYHSDQSIREDFLVSYAIEELSNGEAKKVLLGHKRQRSAPVIPFLGQLDISKLPSGNYQLAVEIRDRSSQLLSRKTIFFQRSNPYLWLDTEALAGKDLREEFTSRLSPGELKYSLRALTPRLPRADVEIVNDLLKNDSVAAQRLYLFSFWSRQHPNQPEEAYRKYMEVADAVNDLFQSGFRYGFETDRGYIYLKYGQPDDILTQEEEPSAPPYEIWTYYQFPATRQTDVRFIFYNPSLAPGDFLLLHSTARGELNNPQWQRQLYRNAPNEIEGGNYLEGTEMIDNFNRRAGRLFRDN